MNTAPRLYVFAFGLDSLSSSSRWRLLCPSPLPTFVGARFRESKRSACWDDLQRCHGCERGSRAKDLVGQGFATGDNQRRHCRRCVVAGVRPTRSHGLRLHLVVHHDGSEWLEMVSRSSTMWSSPRQSRRTSGRPKTQPAPACASRASSRCPWRAMRCCSSARR